MQPTGSPSLTPTATRPPSRAATRTPSIATPTATPLATPEPTAPPTSAPTPVPTSAPTVAPTPTVQQPGLLFPVSKQVALPSSYVPPGLIAVAQDWLAPGFPNQRLRSEAAAALADMLSAAAADGLAIRTRSSYRSYAEQETTFQYWVDTLGLEQAERVSARAGHSEHQLGSTVDLTAASVGWQLVESFGATAEGEWLAANAYRFGFALSYPDGKEPVTGYSYEPWHYRYIGVDVAAAWRVGGLTLVEYLQSL